MASSDSARDAALNELTKLYDVRFKTLRSKRISAERRNKISLFLYSGPIGNVELIDIEEANLRHGLSPASLPVPYEWLWTGRFGQMFTGDAYLKTRSQWASFEAFFRPHGRLGRGAIFQVMHHGSKANWQKGLASRLQPLASVFCSDPAGHLKHP